MAKQSSSNKVKKRVKNLRAVARRKKDFSGSGQYNHDRWQRPH